MRKYIANLVLRLLYPRSAVFTRDDWCPFEQLSKENNTQALAYLAARYLASETQKADCTEMKVSLTGLYRNDEVLGDWEVIVRKVN